MEPDSPLRIVVLQSPEFLDAQKQLETVAELLLRSLAKLAADIAHLLPQAQSLAMATDAASLINNDRYRIARELLKAQLNGSPI